VLWGHWGKSVFFYGGAADPMLVQKGQSATKHAAVLVGGV
jgi:hypothetical protein